MVWAGISVGPGVGRPCFAASGGSGDGGTISSASVHSVGRGETVISGASVTAGVAVGSSVAVGSGVPVGSGVAVGSAVAVGSGVVVSSGVPVGSRVAVGSAVAAGPGVFVVSGDVVPTGRDTFPAARPPPQLIKRIDSEITIVAARQNFRFKRSEPFLFSGNLPIIYGTDIIYY